MGECDLPHSPDEWERDYQAVRWALEQAKDRESRLGLRVRDLYNELERLKEGILEARRNAAHSDKCRCELCVQLRALINESES